MKKHNMLVYGMEAYKGFINTSLFLNLHIFSVNFTLFSVKLAFFKTTFSSRFFLFSSLSKIMYRFRFVLFGVCANMEK